MNPNPRLSVVPTPQDQLTQERFVAWAKLPAIEVKHFAARDAAWNLYVDARDGLADGTTANESRRRSKSDDEKQPSLFGGGVQ